MKKTTIQPLLIILLLAFGSCSKKKVQLILYNGNIYTLDNNFSSVEAIAINNGIIRYTGSNDDVFSEYSCVDSVDLKGATVYPGFIDAHCHFYGYSTDLLKCDLVGTKSYAEVLERISEFSKTNSFSWILGRGWDQNDWEDKSYPSNRELDSLFPNTPVYLMRIDGHAVICNSKALELAGIDATTSISGGEILKSNDIPTGLLIDNAVDKAKAKIPPYDRELIEEALLRGQRNVFAAGLTTVDDAGLGKDSISILLDMQQRGLLRLRIYAMVSDDSKSLEYFFKRGPLKTERLSVSAIKIYADGALGSRGACLKQPYSDKPGHYGFMLRSKNYMDRIAGEALENGFQLCVHAIGDSAAETVIDVYKNHLSSENNKRWRIEHCQVVSPKDRKEMGENNIIPSVQPTHATSDMYWVQDRIGKNRMSYAYAYEDLRDACNGMIAFGTDFPVEDISPIHTFYAAVTRKDLRGYPEKGFLTENKTKRKDALRAMTIWAAYANFEEETKGSLVEGKVADLVVLDRDLLKVSDEEIPGTKVIATYVGGERVFSAD